MEALSRNQEDRILAVQYAHELSERYPFNQDIAKCATLESAFFLALEKEHMRIPAELGFDALEKDIPEAHKERLKSIWGGVLKARMAWEVAHKALTRKWQQEPVNDNFSEEPKVVIELSERRAAIRTKFQKGFEAIQSNGPVMEGEERDLTELGMWKAEERGLRWNFYRADKNYLLALRLYYEMLLEKKGEPDFLESNGPETARGESILALDHPRRHEIMIRNRYLRLIDTTHQAATIAKAVHHQQKKGRLRRKGNVAYWTHPLAVMGAYIQDVTPYIIEESRMESDFILGVTATVLHDIDEDADEPLEELIDEFLAGRTDTVDSTLSQDIKAGFHKIKKEIREKFLSLIKQKTRQWLRGILRALSKNTIFHKEELNTALKQNIAGPKKMREILIKSKLYPHTLPTLEEPVDQASLEKYYAGLEINPQNIQTPRKTFIDFPEDTDSKLDAFLIRLNALTKDDKRQITLIAKLLDRANNLETLLEAPVKEGKDPKVFQRTMLRATVTRLIAWAVLDHDKKKFPLYNTLPRLVDITLEKYTKFQESLDPSERDPVDDQYIHQLTEWSRDQDKVPRYAPSSKVQEVHEEYYRAAA